MKNVLFYLKYVGLALAALGLLLLLKPVGRAQGKPTETRTASGTVLETTNAASYTYVKVDTGKEKIWAAAPQCAIKVGDRVSFSKDMPMKNFQSKALNRTFDVVYFSDSLDGSGAGPLAPPNPHGMGHAGAHGGTMGGKTTPPAAIDFSGLKKADGGLTIAEVYQQKDKLDKKQVTFRGKVVKYNAQIMNKNWAHIQDGTGTPGANDVTVTTDDSTKVGDTVLVKGTVALHKDYGFGYKYDLVVEDAKLTLENLK